MSIRNLIILSQLNPPAQSSRILKRERINSYLSKSLNYPVTILEAGTGYGKSTSIVSYLRDMVIPSYWFTISGTDRDSKLFMAKLFSAFNQKGEAIGEEALRILDLPDSTAQEAQIAFLNAVEQSKQDEILFILDDFHRVRDVEEIMRYLDWMIENIPKKLHIIISTRHKLVFPNMNKWRVKGRLLEISKDNLIFNIGETNRLFDNQYGITLSLDETQQLLNKTEGWAIGLQMVWQSLQNNPKLSIAQVLEDASHSRTALFGYLAEEVFSGLSPEIQKFLTKTSILSKLESATCDFLLNIGNSEKMLRHLNNSGLFIEELRPGVYRFHQIFREFLMNRLQNDPSGVKELHRKLASYFQAHEYWEETIYHLISAGDFNQINRILENIGERMIHEGRHESVNYWIHGIPESTRKKYPHINFLLGELSRYLNRFDDALEYYHIAERLYRKRHDNIGISKSLQGQGQVFLDTIRPINANQLLEDALERLNPIEMPEEVADLLVMTAENQLNLGYPQSAEILLAKASKLNPELDKETDYIQARVLLRTGRLQEGIDLLLKLQDPDLSIALARPQRFHRESALLLSLFYAIKGEKDLAEEYARKGIEIGKLLQSTFVQSVAYMRLGHALMLQSQHPFYSDGFDRAMEYFQESIEKVDVTRIHVEPLWGICRALGYSGNIEKAVQVAEESLQIAKNAGDEWITILIQLSIGASAVLTGDFTIAQQYLTTSEVSSIKVGDHFVLCVSRMWLAIKAWKQGYQNTAFGYLEKLISMIREHQFEFLLTQETLMGLKDPEIIYPLLCAAHKNKIAEKFICSLLEKRGIHENNNYHPGYTLWVQTFDEFKIWRGDQLISQEDWKREKAKQLFQLLVAYRDKWLHRDQINSILWADMPVEKATNYLKVVVNAMNQVLEPDRPRGLSAFFVERRQGKYRLNPKARIIVDADKFTKLIEMGTATALENAIKLYQGRYFEDSYIQEWLMIENQYYHEQFLMAAEKITSQYLDESENEKALDLTYKILTQDDLWEPAYRSQMRIFHRMGQLSMVRKVFFRCKGVLQNQLDTEVSPATIKLYKTLNSE